MCNLWWGLKRQFLQRVPRFKQKMTGRYERRSVTIRINNMKKEYFDCLFDGVAEWRTGVFDECLQSSQQLWIRVEASQCAEDQTGIEPSFTSRPWVNSGERWEFCMTWEKRQMCWRRWRGKRRVRWWKGKLRTVVVVRFSHETAVCAQCPYWVLSICK